MPFADVPGVSLYYEIHGSGPWLVFAHGAGGNHLSWFEQVPAFRDRYRCLIYDQRGWGRSACDGCPDPAAFAGDLLALLDHLGAERAALVGQSMGGWSVLGATLAAPARVTHLVLTGTIAGLTDDDMLRRLIEGHDPTAEFDPHLALAADFPKRDPAKTFLYDEIAAMNPPMVAEFLPALIRLRYAVPAKAPRMPLRLIAGDGDRLFPPELIRAAHAKLPGADLVMVAGAGHSVYFERPGDFNGALAELLQRPGGDT